MSTVRVAPQTALHGEIDIPPDKSITHRAILFGAISDRTVRVDGPLDSEDTAAALSAIEACGVTVRGHLGDHLEIDGVGIAGLRPRRRIDCANAGTLMRLFAGILVGQTYGEVTLDGDDSLRRRPMSRIATPLTAMGARIYTAPGGTPPLVISPAEKLRGHRHELTLSSGQVKSCLLLAGLSATGETWVSEPHLSRDHTERMLAACGVDVRHEGRAVGVVGPVEALSLPDLTVPGDFSSAAFHLVAGVLRADPQIRLRGVNLNPTRAGLLGVLTRMGAEVDVVEREPMGGEPFGDLIVRRSSTLTATQVTGEEVPSMVDELPLVGLLGVFADGVTSVRGAHELRTKESDRVASVCAALRAMGAQVDEHDDGFDVHGTGSLAGGVIDSVGDHRLAMLGAIAGLASDEGVSIKGFEVAAVSYPGFARDIAALGGAA